MYRRKTSADTTASLIDAAAAAAGDADEMGGAWVWCGMLRASDVIESSSSDVIVQDEILIAAELRRFIHRSHYE